MSDETSWHLQIMKNNPEGEDLNLNPRRYENHNNWFGNDCLDDKNNPSEYDFCLPCFRVVNRKRNLEIIANRSNSTVVNQIHKGDLKWNHFCRIEFNYKNDTD